MVDLVTVTEDMVVVAVQLLVVVVVVMEVAMMQDLGVAMEEVVVVQVRSMEVEVGMVVQGMVGTIPMEDRMLYFVRTSLRETVAAI